MTDHTPLLELASRPIHRMGFGAMQLAGPGVFGPPRDREEAISILKAVREVGIDHIDTAAYYGPDVVNELIREVLWPYPETLVIVSKVGAVRDQGGGWTSAQEPHQLRAGVIDNLRSLDVTTIDVVNLRLHDSEAAVGPDTLFDRQLTEMIALRTEGKIRGIGLSNVSSAHLTYAKERTEIACIQNAFNLMDRSSSRLLRTCEEYGVPFVPFFPLGSGFGANAVLTNHTLVEIAGGYSCTPAQLAAAWLLHYSPAIALIPGTSSITHFHENHAASMITLDADTMATLDALSLVPVHAT